MIMKCDVCGKEFGYGNRDDGLPNGVTFVTKKGRITMCADCVIEMGKRSEDEQKSVKS